MGRDSAEEAIWKNVDIFEGFLLVGIVFTPTGLKPLIARKQHAWRVWCLLGALSRASPVFAWPTNTSQDYTVSDGSESSSA